MAPDSADGEVQYAVSDRVARITINRPHRRNALTWTAIEELSRGLERAGADPEVRVVVLRGAGDVAFCAGIDLSEMEAGDSAAARHRPGAGWRSCSPSSGRWANR